MRDDLRVDIIIPVYGSAELNNLQYLKRMMDSLFKFTHGFRLIIVDDCSPCKDTKIYLHKQVLRFRDAGIEVVPLAHRHQFWYTRSANDGLRVPTKAKFAGVLNTDIILCEGWLEKLLEYFFDDKRVMMVASDYKGPKFKPKVSYPEPPSYATGHCFLVRRKVFEVLGLLDETYPHINSDKYFCYRIVKAGGVVVRDHKVPIRHYGGKSWGYSLAKMFVAESKLPRARNFIREVRKKRKRR